MEQHQAIIRSEYPKALYEYVHCSAHSLNLPIGYACQTHMIRNCIHTVRSIKSFFKKSAQRTNILKTHIKSYLPESNHDRLISMCETRWAQNHESIKRLHEMYISIINTLEELREVINNETSQKAHTFLATISKRN
jgi:hypothetical protein